MFRRADTSAWITNMTTDFVTVADDYYKAITTPDNGNDEGEQAMQALAKKYNVQIGDDGCVLAALFCAAANGTLHARVRAAQA